MTLFRKWGLLIAFVLALFLGFTGLVIYCGEERVLFGEAAHQERFLLDGVRKVARESMLTHDDLLLSSYVRQAAARHPEITRLAVRNAESRVVADTDPMRLGDLEANWVADSKRHIRIFPLDPRGRLPGDIYLAIDAHRRERLIKETLQGLRRRLEVVLAIGALLGFLVAAKLASSISRPVEELERFSEAIARGELNRRLPEGRSDEIGGLSRSLNRMAQALGELDRMKDDFVAAVSHELRSPLGAMSVCLKVIRQESAARQEGAPFWDRDLTLIETNLERLSGFVGDLLEVAALERGTLHVRFQQIELASLAEEIRKLFLAQTAELNVALEVSAPTIPIHAWADPEYTRRILINLVSNALKFTPSDGRVTIELCANQSSSRVSVRDTGPGISAEDQTKLFKKFSQIRSGENSRGRKGTGLGLAIAKLLADLQKGTLTLESKVGLGSVFTLSLPKEKISA